MNHRPRSTWRLAVFALPAGLVVLATGCLYEDEDGSGDMATVRYEDLDDVEISGLVVHDDIDVDVVVAPRRTQSAELRIDDNLLDRGEAFVDDGVLSIGADGLGDVDPSQTPHVTLTVQHLDTIENHGDGDVAVIGVDADSVEVVNDGDGSVVVHGHPTTTEATVDGDGALVTS